MKGSFRLEDKVMELATQHIPWHTWGTATCAHALGRCYHASWL